MSQQELLNALAARLYSMGKLSIGQAAELTGYTKAAFMELLSNYGVSIFNFAPEDLDRDIKNAGSRKC